MHPDNDIEIRLKRRGGDEPLTMMSATYPDVARMGTRALVDAVVEAFSSHVDGDIEYTLVLDERHRSAVSKNVAFSYHPHNAGFDPAVVLRRYVEGLVRGWRSLSTLGLSQPDGDGED